MRAVVRPLRLVPVAVATALVAAALAGCGLTDAVVTHQRQGTAATPGALALAWSTPATQPDWLPADASRIRWVAATRGGADRAPAALLLRSGRRLPGSCVPLTTAADPAIRASWLPSPRPSATVRCGNWAVVAVAGGYAAWTPVDGTAIG